MARLRFGLALDFGTERASVDRVLDDYLPLVALAERHGFESVWAGEGYPRAPGSFHLPSPFLLLAALARETRLSLGTGVTLLPAWHPLKLAYDAAMLDQVSGGRFILGVGVGNPSVWRRFGVDPATVGDWMDDALAALRALWSGAAGYQGQQVAVDGGIWPLPLQRGGPPMWIGGTRARSARRAAALGNAWYAATSYPLATIRQQVERYRAALAAQGLDPRQARVSVNRLTVLAESSERAWADGGRYVEGVLAKYQAMRGLPGPAAAARGSAAGFPEPATGVEAPLLTALGSSLCLLGAPELVVEQLETYVEAGVTDVQLRVVPSDLPLELAARTIALVGEQVLPRFR